MFKLNNNMKINAAKILSEFIIAKYGESFLLTALEDMEDDDCYFENIITINGKPVECYKNIVRTISYEEFEDGSYVAREIAIIVNADEKAILVDVTITRKLTLTDGVLDIEYSSAFAHEISIDEALNLLKD